MTKDYFEFIRKFAIFAVFPLGILVRLYHLDFQSVWGDELATIYFLRVDFFQLIQNIANCQFGDVHPPFYYFVLFFWIKLFGETSLATRSLACIFGVLGISMIFYLGKELSRRCVGTLAALIYALSAFNIYYSQEGRQYTFLSLVIMGSFLCYAKIVKFYMGERDKEPGKLIWLAYFVFNFLGIYTHYYVFLGLFVQFLFLFYIRNKQLFIKYAVMHFILFLTFIPWLFVFFNQLSSLQDEGGKLMSRFHPIFSMPFVFAKMAVFGNENFVMDHKLFYLFTFLVFTASFILGCIYFFKDSMQWTTLLLMSLFIPVILVYVMTISGIAIYSSHPFIMFSFPLYIIIARIFTQKGILNYSLYGLVLLLNIFVVFNLNWSDDYTKPKVKEAFSYILETGENDDLIGKVPRFLPGTDAYDVWVWDHYNDERLKMLDLSGETVEVISDKITNQMITGERIWIGFSVGRGNDDTIAGLAKILSESFKELDRKLFSSKIRGNTIELIYYEKVEKDKKSISG